jgi:hypothetical protein
MISFSQTTLLINFASKSVKSKKAIHGLAQRAIPFCSPLRLGKSGEKESQEVAKS